MARFGTSALGISALAFAWAYGAPTSALAQPAPSPPGSAAPSAPAAAAPSAPASNAPSDAQLEQADRLFEEGRALAASGDFAGACAKFDESHRLRPGIGTLFNLADCHEKQGKLPLAYNEYVEVAERTKVALQADREKVARERIAALEMKIGRIAFETPTDPKDLVIELDGVEIPASAWKSPIAVEPGTHQVRYGQRGTALKEQAVEARAAATPVVVDISRETTVGADDAGSGGERRPGMIVAGSVLMGTGLISLGISGWLFQNKKDKKGAAIATGLGGLACLGVGVPVFVIGVKKHPVEGPAPAAPQARSIDDESAAGAFLRPEIAATSSLPWSHVEAGPVPAVAIGPASATAGWRF